MGLLLRIAQVHIPAFVKKNALQELFDSTALAFQCKPPRIKGLSLEEGLIAYALFTKKETEKSLQQGKDLDLLKNHLYQNAYQLGQRLRKILRITALSDAMIMGRILYRMLGIDFQGTAQGEVTIHRCFFSGFYSPPICRVISSLDQGILAGLSGGGQLFFSQRITEGGKCCKARLVPGESPL